MDKVALKPGRARGTAALARLGASALAILAGAAIAGPAAAEWEFDYSGYLRQYLSVNTEDRPETRADDSAEFSMVRSQLRLDLSAHNGPLTVFGSLRGVREIDTEFLERIDDPGSFVGPSTVAGAMGAFATHGGSTDFYNDRGTDLRELYADFELIPDRWDVRVGKQQVAFGNTDFFQGTDLLHGFDFTWRAFLEPENEELRKPLILLNSTTHVPELDGSLQLIFRPGLDRDKDIGSSFDVNGGRWSLSPLLGNDLEAVTPFDYQHPAGDVEEPTWAARWRGQVGDVDFSLIYLRSFNPEPQVNPCPLFFGPGVDIFKEAPNGLFGDLIYPIVDTVGATTNVYIEPLDIVFSTELAYTFDKPYSSGRSNFAGNPSAKCPFAFLPGFCGIVEKDTLRITLRADYEWNSQNLIGTNKPSIVSFQFFDSWIPSFDDDDELVQQIGFGREREEHSILATGLLSLDYFQDQINVTLVGILDVTYGGGVLIPSIEWKPGDHWRVKLEGDFFIANNTASPSNILPPTQEDDSALFDQLENADQVLLRVTYQF